MPKSKPKSTFELDSNKFVKGKISGFQVTIDDVISDKDIETTKFVGSSNDKNQGLYIKTEVTIVFTPDGVIVVPDCGDPGLTVDKDTLFDLVAQFKKATH